MKKTYLKNSFILGLFATTIFSCKSNDQQFDASGVFDADEVIVSAEASGKILKLNIEEGASLKAGQEIGLIDGQNLSLQKSQVLASIDALGAKQNDASPQTQILHEQLSTQQAQVATQKEQLRVLDKERIRVQNLVKAEAVPSKQLDDIEGQIDILHTPVAHTVPHAAVPRQPLNSHAHPVSIQPSGLLSERKPLQERVAQFDDLLKRCTIINPNEGVVLVKYAEANEMTAAGKPLYKIADLSTLTLRAYISGDQLSKVKLNQTVKVLIDNGKDDYKELSGTVEWISTKAEFTPKTIQTKDERANLVYATKIKVKNDGFLKIGMYGEVKF